MTTRASAAAWTAAGTPADFAADKQDIAGQIAESRVDQACLGCKQDEAPASDAAPVRKGGPMRIAGDLDMGEVIHASPAEMLIARQETRGLDYRCGEPKTDAHPQYRAGVLRNVWLIERHRQGRDPIRLHGCGRGLLK